MQNILADAGPLIALFRKSDRYRPAARRFFESYRGRVLTTWPVVAEVCYMLGFSAERQTAFLTWIQRGGLQVVDLNAQGVARVIDLMRKYADQPMDLADASLVWLAEREDVTDVITIDRRDFLAYRLSSGKAFRNVFTR